MKEEDKGVEKLHPIIFNVIYCIILSLWRIKNHISNSFSFVFPFLTDNIDQNAYNLSYNSSYKTWGELKRTIISILQLALRHDQGFKSFLLHTRSFDPIIWQENLELLMTKLDDYGNF